MSLDLVLPLLVALGVAFLFAQSRAQRRSRPPRPRPVEDDPAPSPDEVNALDKRIEDTDALLEQHNRQHPESDDDRPTLPPDFDLHAPDERAVDLLRGVTGIPTVHDRQK